MKLHAIAQTGNVATKVFIAFLAIQVKDCQYTPVSMHVLSDFLLTQSSAS